MPGTTTSGRWRGCWSGWSGGATPTSGPSTSRHVDAELRAGTVATVGAWRKAIVGSVDRERDWRGRLWPVSLLRGRRK